MILKSINIIHSLYVINKNKFNCRSYIIQWVRLRVKKFQICENVLRISVQNNLTVIRPATQKNICHRNLSPIGTSWDWISPLEEGYYFSFIYLTVNEVTFDCLYRHLHTNNLWRVVLRQTPLYLKQNKRDPLVSNTST